MSLIYSPTQYDTDEIAALRERINHDDDLFNEQVRAHHVLERRNCAAYETLLWARRPVYPTPEHLAGLDAVVQLVRHGIPYGDDLGNPTDADREQHRDLPCSVHFSSRSGQLIVLAQSPYPTTRTGSQRMWAFFPEEEAALRDAVQRRGLRIISEWRLDDGLGFVVAG